MTTGNNPSEPETNFTLIWRLLTRIWWRLLVIGLTVYGCIRLRGLISTLIFTAIFAYVLDPFVEWMTKQRWFVNFHTKILDGIASLKSALNPFKKDTPPKKPHHSHAIRSFAVIYALVVSLIAVIWGGRQIVTPFAAEIKELSSPAGQEKLTKRWEEMRVNYDKTAPDGLKSEKLIDLAEERFQEWAKSEEAGKLAKELGGSVLHSFEAIIEALLVPILAFYVLVDGKRLKHEFVGMLPRRKWKVATQTVNDFNQIMRSYIYGQFWLCVIAFVVIWLWLFFTKTSYPFILAAFAGITRAIPVIGPIFGTIPIAFWQLQEQGAGMVVAFAIFFSILHIIETKIIMPLMIGDRVDLHPVVIIAVLLVGAQVGNIIVGGQIGTMLGMFFAAPVSALIRVMIRRFWIKVPVVLGGKRKKLTQKKG